MPLDGNLEEVHGEKSSRDEGVKLSMNFMEGLNVAQQPNHSPLTQQQQQQQLRI